MDETSARTILSWCYDEPYALYNMAPGQIEESLQAFLDRHNAYHAITDEHGDLMAYCCFGPDAQVLGGDYNADALDVGIGVRPDLTGRGLGFTLLNAVLGFARRMFTPSMFRATVAEFNKRALRVCEKVGFRPVQTFQRDRDGRAFVVLVRKV